jgi:putative acetyltransferase
MYRIREAMNLDREDIREVHLGAFPEGERQIVATLAVNLLSEATSLETIALVAEVGGTVVGHIAFSPVTLENKERWKGYILAPLGVKPEFQKHGIGSGLIESGKKRLSESEVNVLYCLRRSEVLRPVWL